MNTFYYHLTVSTQFQSLTNAMTILVHQVIKKYINPTKYRQIIETESGERLTSDEQRIISEDQKHSSTVAKIFYKKKHSRMVAVEGKKCMDQMTREYRLQSSNLMGYLVIVMHLTLKFQRKVGK